MLVLVRIFKHDTLSGEISPDSGISHCILTLDSEPVRQNTGKPVIATTLAIRLLLDIVNNYKILCTF